MNTQIVVFIAFFALLVVAAGAWRLRRRAQQRAKAQAASVRAAPALTEQPLAAETDVATPDAAEAPAPLEPPTSAPQVEPHEAASEAVRVARDGRDALAPGEVATDAARGVRHPIVLAHGLMGFDTIGFGRLKHAYFRGVPERLRALGVDVYVLSVPPFASIRKRAERLARQIEALPAERVNIVAHSMGGLDARYAISHLGIASRVVSLTTIGTPHNGTPLATLAARLLRTALRRVLATADLDGVCDLTPESMARFNRDVPDVAGVEYMCCIATINVPAVVRLAKLPLLPARPVAASDGLVPCDSQRWGAVLCEINADHWAQIGWSVRFDAASFYVGVVKLLAERGF